VDYYRFSFTIDKYKKTPIEIALKKKNYEVVDIFINKLINVRKSNIPHFCDIFEQLLQHHKILSNLDKLLDSALEKPRIWQEQKIMPLFGYFPSEKDQMILQTYGSKNYYLAKKDFKKLAPVKSDNKGEDEKPITMKVVNIPGLMHFDN